MGYQSTITLNFVALICIIHCIAIKAQINQCNLSVELPSDSSVCTYPNTFMVNANIFGNFDYFEWTPATLFNSPNNPNSSVTINNPITLRATAYAIDSSLDHVVNGDFALGNNDFTSQYTYQPPNGPLSGHGVYTIGSNPTISNGNFQNCDDITGEGEMLIGDGAQFPNINFWCQAFTLDPNTSYHFSFYSTSVYSASPSSFTININGAPHGKISSNTSQTCEWVLHEFIFNSGNSSSIEVCIECTNLNTFGNDFAVDNIRLYSMCQDSSSFTITEPNEVYESRDTSLCEGDSFDFFGQNISTSGTFSHSFSGINGCDTTISLEVNVIPDQTTLFSDFNVLNCKDSIITIHAIPSLNATPNTSYSWSTFGGNIISSLPWNDDSISVDEQGLYQLMVEVNIAGKSCSFRKELYIISDQLEPTFEILPFDSIRCQQREISIQINPDDSSYITNWQTSDGNIIDTSNWAIQVDREGNYTVHVSDPDNGCSSSKNFELAASTEVPDISFDIQNISCKLDTGRLSLLGEVSQLDSFIWASIDGTIYRTDSFSLLGGPGKYEAILFYGNDCLDTLSAHIIADKIKPFTQVDFRAELNCHNPTSRIEVKNDSGTFIQLSFNGATLDSSQFAMINQAGQYILTSTDTLNGCSSIDTLTIIENFRLPDLSISGQTSISCERDSIHLKTQAQEPTTYYWLNQYKDTISIGPEVQLNRDDTILLIGTLEENGCADSLLIPISIDTAQPKAFLPKELVLNCKDSLPIYIYIPDSLENQQFSFTNSTNWTLTDNEIALLDTGHFELIIIDTINGCKTRDSVQLIDQRSSPSIFIAGLDTLQCNDSLSISINTPPQSIMQWFFAGTSGSESNFIVQEPGTLNIYVEDTINFCSLDSSIQIISDQEIPKIQLEGIEDTLSCGKENLNISLNSVSPEWFIAWTNSNDSLLSSQPDLTIQTAGNYTVLVRDTISSCSNMQTFSIAIDTAPPALDLDSVFLIDCIRTAIDLEGQTTNGLTAIIFEQDTQYFEDQIELSAPGKYTFWQRSAKNYCISTQNFRIESDTLPPDLIFPESIFRACIDSVNQLDLADLAYSSNYQSVVHSLADTFNIQNSKIPLKELDYLDIKTWNIDNGCHRTDSFRIEDAPLDFELHITQNANCSNKPAIIELVNLVSEGVNFSFTLNDPEMSSVTFPLELVPGDYAFTMTDALGCALVKEISVPEPEPLQLNSIPIIETAFGQRVNPIIEYRPTERNITAWEWRSELTIDCGDCIEPSIIADNGWVQVWAKDDQNCVDSTEFQIRIRYESDIYLPNIFTPNGDNINDIFFPQTGENISQVKSMEVFDRWGNLLFNRKDFAPNIEALGWNGTTGGNEAPEGIYVYRLEFITLSGQKLQKIGDLSLLR